jgi:RNA polymerase sigma-70 factor, ECF subfamily
MNLDDSQVMQRVQSGEFQLFDVLVERYRPALVRVAAGMLADEALAEDVVQETFLAVFAARHTYKPLFPFRTWLWTILLNLCRRQRARRGRRPQEFTPLCSAEGMAPQVPERSTSETALTGLLRRERSARLAQLLDELPEGQADAIRLRFFAGLSYDEMAEAMGVSRSGAKLRVRSGLEKLSQRLSGDQEICNEL